MDFENNQIPQQAPVAPVQPQLPQANKPKSKLPLLIGVVAVVAIIAVIAIALIGGSGYKKAVENTLDLACNFNTDNIESLLPDVIWEEYADEADMEVDELIEEIKEQGAEAKEAAEENGISRSYEIGEYEKLDKDDVEDLKEDIADNYDSINEDDIGNTAYSVEVSYEFTYEDYPEENYEDDGELYVIKVNGDWYVVNEEGYFMGF